MPDLPPPYDRRRFLQLAGAGTAYACGLPVLAKAKSVLPLDQIITVTGPIPSEQLGTALTHEHVLVDFVGADQVGPDRYDGDEVFRVVMPHLRRLREAGCQALFECTPAYLGRDPQLLARLSEATGLRLITNTGYYAAVQKKYLPEHALRESAEQLAQRWLKEWQDGIEGTQVRPGFIKLGFDAGPLDMVAQNLLHAAAQVHRESGLTIAAHTGDGRAAVQQLELLQEAGVSPAAWIWVHAQNEQDEQLHLRMARAGGWVSLDGVSPRGLQRHVQLATRLKDEAHLDRLLVSQDAGWYSVGEPRGGDFRPYDFLFDQFVPALREAGWDEPDLDRLLRDNPARAFAIHKRLQS